MSQQPPVQPWSPFIDVTEFRTQLKDRRVVQAISWAHLIRARNPEAIKNMNEGLATVRSGVAVLDAERILMSLLSVALFGWSPGRIGGLE